MVDPLAIYFKVIASSGQWLAALQALETAKIVIHPPMWSMTSLSHSTANVNTTNKLQSNMQAEEQLDQRELPYQHSCSLSSSYMKIDHVINAEQKYTNLLSEEAVVLLTQTMLNASKWEMALQAARQQINSFSHTSCCCCCGDNVATRSISATNKAVATANVEKTTHNTACNTQTSSRSLSAYKLAIRSVMNILSESSTLNSQISSSQLSSQYEELWEKIACMAQEAIYYCNLSNKQEYVEQMKLMDELLHNCNVKRVQEQIQSAKDELLRRSMERHKTKSNQNREIEETEKHEQVVNSVNEIEISETPEEQHNELEHSYKYKNADLVTKCKNGYYNKDNLKTNMSEETDTGVGKLANRHRHKEESEEEEERQDELRGELHKMSKASHLESWNRALELWSQLTEPSNEDLHCLLFVLTNARREAEIINLITSLLRWKNYSHEVYKGTQETVSTSLKYNITAKEQELLSNSQRFAKLQFNISLVKELAECALCLRSRKLALTLLCNHYVNNFLTPSSAVPIVEVLKQLHEEDTVINWWNQLHTPMLTNNNNNNNIINDDKRRISLLSSSESSSLLPFSSSCTSEGKGKFDLNTDNIVNNKSTLLSLREHIKLCSYVATCIAQRARRQIQMPSAASSPSPPWKEVLNTFEYSAKHNPSLALLFALRTLRITQSWEPAVELYTTYLHEYALRKQKIKPPYLSNENINKVERADRSHAHHNWSVWFSLSNSIDHVKTDNTRDITRGDNTNNNNYYRKIKFYNRVKYNSQTDTRKLESERTHHEIQRIFEVENPSQWIPASELARLKTLQLQTNSHQAKNK